MPSKVMKVRQGYDIDVKHLNTELADGWEIRSVNVLQGVRGFEGDSYKFSAMPGELHYLLEKNP